MPWAIAVDIGIKLKPLKLLSKLEELNNQILLSTFPMFC